MSEIFDETNMRRILGKHIPEGETLLAGIHGISQEVQIRGIFGKCIRTEDKLIPDEKGASLHWTRERILLMMFTSVLRNIPW